MKKITIYHTNDIHSEFEKFVQIASYLKQNADSHDWILDAGDFADEKHIAVAGTAGKGASALLEMAGYDALTLGNNEYFQGIDGILGLAQNKVPILSCNIIYEDGRKIAGIKPYILSEKNGIRLLIIGVSPYGGYSDFLSLLGLDCKNPISTITHIIEKERKNFDLCVLLSHAGIECDRELAKKVAGIDVIIGGHSHTLMPGAEKIGNTYIHQSGEYGNYLGKIEVSMENGRVKAVQAVNLKNEFSKDTVLTEKLEKQTRIGNAYYNQTLYTLPDDLDYSPVHECRILNAICDIEEKRLYVLEKDKELLAACALCSSNAGAEAVEWSNKKAKAFYIDRLGVRTEALGKGLAGILLNEAAALAKEKGAEYLRLFVVDCNLPAINLYQKNGMKKVPGIYAEKVDEELVLQEFGFEKQLH